MTRDASKKKRKYRVAGENVAEVSGWGIPTVSGESWR